MMGTKVIKITDKQTRRNINKDILTNTLDLSELGGSGVF
jgi:hypothetical protein